MLAFSWFVLQMFTEVYHRVFPAICKYCLHGFPTTYTIFPFEEYRVSLWFLQPFSIEIAGKIYRHPVSPCKHLQCVLHNNLLTIYCVSKWQNKKFISNGKMFSHLYLPIDVKICLNNKRNSFCFFYLYESLDMLK